MLIRHLINILCLPQEVPHRQIWINHFLRCSATFPMAWAGVQVARRQVALALPEISSLLPRPLLMEEISPHWGTCRPLPLSHLLSPPVLVPISSPIQVRKMDKKMFIAFFMWFGSNYFHWKTLVVPNYFVKSRSVVEIWLKFDQILIQISVVKNNMDSFRSYI